MKMALIVLAWILNLILSYLIPIGLMLYGVSRPDGMKWLVFGGFLLLANVTADTARRYRGKK